MRDRDQKQLELLYESLNGDNALLREERVFAKEFFKYVAVEIVKEVARHHEELEKTPDEFLPTTMYNYFWLQLKEIPENVLLKLNLNSHDSKCFAELYKIIVKDMTHNTIVLKKVKGKLSLVVVSPVSEDLTTIPLLLDTEPNSIANKLEECFKQYLKFAFTDENTIKKLEKEKSLDTWAGKGFVWRKERAKYNKMEQNLPEIEGIF
jgi:hypothetical protein